MRDKRIFKVLTNGYAVPYPEELVYKDIIMLKDYRLNDFPKNSIGKFDETVPYVEWLQEYLYRCEIDLTEEQRKLSDYISSHKDFDCRGLGWNAGYYESCHALRDHYDFPADFAENPCIDNLKGTFYSDPYQVLLECMSDLDDEEKPSKLEFILEE